VKRYLLFAIVTVVALAADQLTKVWAVAALKGKPTVTVIEGFFDLHYVENPGATWGFLADSPGLREPILIGVAVLASLFILWMARKLQPGQRLVPVALALVLSGAVGNLIDRVRLSVVIDFISLHAGEAFRWPTFNVADIAIVVGVALLLVDSVRSWLRERREKRAKQAAQASRGGR
jgi:signal peptidase II